MASLLAFHLMGLYPVAASKQLLIGSPFLSSYTIRNNFFNTQTTFTVKNFDSATLIGAPPAGSRLYVKSITINGKANPSLCWIDFDDVVGGGEVVIEVYGDATAAANAGCGSALNALPDSLETGGFT
jgi:putative alpha-1,2-mannosidase